MRISRISRPDALNDASISAHTVTVEEADQVFLNPVEFGDVIDVNISKATGSLKSPTSADIEIF